MDNNPFLENFVLPNKNLFTEFCEGKFDTITITEDQISKIVNSQLNMDFRPDVLWTFVHENFLPSENSDISRLRQYIEIAIKHQCYRIAITAFCPEHASLVDSWVFKPFPNYQRFAQLIKIPNYFDGFPLVNVEVFINHNGEIEALLSSNVAYHNYDDVCFEEVEELNFN